MLCRGPGWSAVAAKTSKIALGTGVTCPIPRAITPPLSRKLAATMGCVAPGPSLLSRRRDRRSAERVFGHRPVARLQHARARPRRAEAIELIRALWTGEKITHEGAYYQSHQAKLYTLPGQPIPLYVSTMVPNSAHFAGKYGSGLITVGGGEPEMYRQILENFEAGAREAGKDPSRMPRMCGTRRRLYR